MGADVGVNGHDVTKTENQTSLWCSRFTNPMVAYDMLCPHRLFLGAVDLDHPDLATTPCLTPYEVDSLEAVVNSQELDECWRELAKGLLRFK